jgi:hypothetical protein
MTDRDNERVWEGRFSREADRFTDHPVRTILKWFVGFAVLLLILGQVTGVVRVAGLWGDEAARVVSPANVKEQYSAVIGDWQDLMVAADNVCAAQQATPEEGDPTITESPVVSYQAIYRSVRADYNSHQLDIFEAGKVGPPGYPKSVPVYSDLEGPDGDWCKISERLRAIHE